MSRQDPNFIQLSQTKPHQLHPSEADQNQKSLLMRPKVGSPWARAVLGSRNSASSAARRSTRASRRGRLRPLCSCCVSRFVCLSSQASCTSTRRCSTCPTNQKGHCNDCRRLGAARKSRLQRLHSQGSIPFGLVPLPHPPDLRRTPPPPPASGPGGGGPSSAT